MANSAFLKSSISLDSPVFTTKITTPIVYGGVGTTSTLTLNGTSNVSASGSIVLIQPTGGNVGIGTTTPMLFGSCYPGITVGTTAGLMGSCSGRGNYLTDNTYFDNSNWRYKISNYASYLTQYNGGLSFSTAPSGTTGTISTFTVPLTILSSGNVGIGTTAPIYLQHNVMPFAKTDTTLRVLSFLSSNEASASNPFGLRIAITGGATTAARTISLQTTEYSLIDGGNLTLQAGGGYVGIHTPTPVAELDVCGPLNLRSGNNGDRNAIQFSDYAGTQKFYMYLNAGVLKFGDTADRVCIAAGGGYATCFWSTSDCRLKKDILPISNALSMVTQLCGVCYHRYDDEKNENNIGLIAQDVFKVLPEVVSHSIPDENDFKLGICDEKLSISYGNISSVLIEAIKELKTQNDSLIKRIEILENK